jgi:hypothetical protein
MNATREVGVCAGNIRTDEMPGESEVDPVDTGRFVDDQPGYHMRDVEGRPQTIR